MSFQNEVSFSLPQKITSNIKGFEELFEFRQKILSSKRNNIKVSFENIDFFEPILCSVLGAIFEDIENKSKKLEYVNLYKLAKLDSIFIRNSFIPRFFKKEYKDSFTEKDKEIPYKKFSIDESEKYNDFIKKEVLEKPNFPLHSEKLGDKIKENIFEIFENARTHGKCNYIHTCGHFKNNRLSIAIVDSGISIINNVKNHLKDKQIKSCDCIQWAMEKGNTTKNGNIPGGLGLDIIFQFINLNKGRAQILSSDGYWELKSGKEPIKEILKYGFDGTIAILEFNLNDNNSYQLTSEEQQLNNIF
ncbi:hypothetical protein J2Q11_09920 [Tenacibaculum finnmarkense genomovar finnmarkense]|uniref:hypothetical protein n=1 Tax=Tenacibaculum finnmarkense TaxID=2781243 RepID=UPI001E441AF7|nr:hypothetical protein [Tenacibaculum finnmarkense]MCD8417978.1 hypothetical protein [Tenacibaculum finnmarkense genomovar finnmarkense]MCG8186365.1 hypothetical protein [Tenacibaculum finnmarkense genomovar finnmarkense]MCG8202904.1 hypothetical protein [Tenacibaculum finnmarkense genomovar finnmarkense]MCG8210166.1 hypothetical protein [Tenacibaculum finnmarkense genomovar finnmarkense]MCG8213185.1 hypothetical protein [Tenacibaculum finnmarkense genomovar finnmarkense]